MREMVQSAINVAVAAGYFSKGMCLAEAKKPRDFTRLKQKSVEIRVLLWLYLALAQTALFIDGPKTDSVHKQGTKFHLYRIIQIFQRNLWILWQQIRVIRGIRMHS